MAQSPDRQSHDPGNPYAGDQAANDFSIQETAQSVLRALASLKITCALFFLAIFLVFAGTLAQVGQDIEAIVAQYFRSAAVKIPFQVFLPESFFPDMQNVRGSFWFPGGWTIGACLMVNLLAAHAIRFKVQAHGARLWGGIGVIALGVLTTWVVIASGNNKDGFQSEPLVEWSVLWEMLKVGMGLLWVGMASSLLKIESDRKLERWTVIGLTVLLGAALVALFMKGDAAKLNDSSMRILWQLIKGTAAGCVLLAGCYLVFRKRAGVVLLHGGVGLIMVNELLVGLNQIENQMPIVEGETVNWVHDVSKAELAIIDRSPKEHNDVVVVPFARLQQAAASGDVVSDDNLPVDFKVLRYFENSKFVDPPAGNRNPATTGLGLEVAVQDAEKTVGTDSDGKVNMASAYIRFFPKGGDKSLGTYLVTQGYTTIQQVEAGEKSFDVVMRSKRTYKPYSLHLIDVRGDTYLGTSKARNYSSEVRLVDKSRNVDREVRIWMNNPLRYAGETFYQQNFNTFEARENGRTVMKEQTVLQVVRNAGWMIPYVACMIVATGMLAHFWIILLRFLNRRAAGVVPVPQEFGGDLSTAPRPEAAATAATGKPSRYAAKKEKTPADNATAAAETGSWQTAAAKYLPLLGVLFFGGWLAGKAVPPSAPSDEMDVYQFGKIPVVYEGRVKPVDSLARNSLRLLSHYQTFRDLDDEKRPATQWFLDMVTHPERADKYRVFRIVNLDLLHELKLPRRKGFRYAYNEFEPRIERLKELSRDARETPSKLRSAFESGVVELHAKVRRYFEIRETHLIPPAEMGNQREQIIRILLDVNPRLSQVPLLVPEKIDDTDWQPLTKMTTPMWIRRYAKARGLKTLQAVAMDLLAARHSEKTMATFRTVVGIRAMSRLRNRKTGMSQAQLRELIGGMVKKLSRFELIGEVQGTLFGRLVADMKGEKLDGESPENVEALVGIFSAYRDGDAAAFNERVAAYRDSLSESSPAQYDAAKVATESWFNHFEPFYYCSVLYIIAFLLSVSALLGWSRPLNLTAMLLILTAFLVHTFALGARMYISGRLGVTVTNLYSSAVFIGWACCLLGLVMEVVFRIGIGNIVAGAAGFGSLLIAHLLSIDGDTIAVMQAVLDTNFWLATHVTSITIGYATTFVAGALGLTYVKLGLLSRRLSTDMGKILNRMIYGSLCFAIFFSFVGTVLGGLWADDSWGRFWGWDPKENGALMIVIWNALVLHARWGGLVKDRGMAVLAIAGNVVTAWSWFGVNLLGVGLHAYGFKDGIGRALALFALYNIIMIAAGCIPKEFWRSFRQPTDQIASTG